MCKILNNELIILIRYKSGGGESYIDEVFQRKYTYEPWSVLNLSNKDTFKLEDKYHDTIYEHNHDNNYGSGTILIQPGKEIQYEYIEQED